MELLDSTLTLTVSPTQLQLIEHGISAELRELAQQPQTRDTKKACSLLWDMRNQIDSLLTAKAAAYRKYDAEHIRRELERD